MCVTEFVGLTAAQPVPQLFETLVRIKRVLTNHFFPRQSIDPVEKRDGDKPLWKRVAESLDQIWQQGVLISQLFEDHHPEIALTQDRVTGRHDQSF